MNRTRSSRRGAALVLVLSSALAGCGSMPPPAEPLAAAMHEAFAPATFLVGCWLDASGTSKSTSVEVWSEPHAGTMYGQGRTMRGTDLIFFELLSIEQRGDKLALVARPRGGEATEFAMTGHTATSSGGRSITFANPQHDFPRRIRYERDGDSLQAIADDGTDSGKRAVFNWRRAR
ncbi:MAG: DUF6265 family protein [Planctomycetota bacterium]